MLLASAWMIAIIVHLISCLPRLPLICTLGELTCLGSHFCCIKLCSHIIRQGFCCKWRAHDITRLTRRLQEWKYVWFKKGHNSSFREGEIKWLGGGGGREDKKQLLIIFLTGSRWEYCPWELCINMGKKLFKEYSLTCNANYDNRGH